MADIESNIRIGVDTSDAIASIKMLQSQISAFQKQMSSTSVANAESARKLRRGLLDDLNATGQWSTSIRTIKSSSEAFTTALEKNKLSMGEYFRYAGASTKTFGKTFTNEFNTIEKVARERVKDLQTQYISLGRDANGALKAISVRPLRLDMNDLATQTAMNAQKQQIFNQLLKQGSTNLLNFGKNTQWAGRQLMVGFTIPLSIFGSQAAKTFMQLEEQAIRFKRVYGELFTPPGEADEMLETLKELGKEFTKYGVAVEKTLGLAADAAAMGKTGTELLDQVTEANRLAVLGNVEQQQALETTISLTNAFGIATEDLANKIDFLNAVENQTVVSIEDLTIAIPKAGPVVQQLGGGVEDLAFFLTAMKEGGINASEGANALKSGLASLINPTDQAANMLKIFGINVKDLVASSRGDVKKLVIDFATALDTLDPSQRAQAIEQLFGKFQFSRLSTLFQNVIQEGTQASRVLELTNATTQELAQLSSKELKRVEESTTFRFKKAIEEFQLAIAPVGEEFLKLITPIIEFATKIIEKFNDLSDGAKSFITGLVVLLGAVGPVALMTFGLLANGVANIIKGFTFVRELFLRTGNQSTILGEQIDYMTQEQLTAAAVAASLDQTHQNLIQTFSVESGAVKRLADVYRQAFNEQQRFDTGRMIAQQAGLRPGLRLASGIVSVPGPKGAGDVVPAMLSPGEAVIPADKAKQYAPLIQGMIAGNIPGYKLGMISPENAKQSYSDLQTAIPNIFDIVEQALAKIELAGRRLTQANLDKEIEKIAGPIVKLARTTSIGGAAGAGSASSTSGINLAHGAAMVKLPVEIAKALGEELQRLGINNVASRSLAGATKDVNAYSNLVFPMPRGFNSGNVGGEDAANFIRQDKSMFTSIIADMYKLDRNDPELLKFAESVANGLESAGQKAISDGEFYDIVYKSMNEMVTSAAKDALFAAKKELATVADPKDRREPLYFGKSISAIAGEAGPGATAVTAASAELSEGRSYVQFRGSAAGKQIMQEANALADTFMIELVRTISARIAADGEIDQIGSVVADQVKDGLGINSPSAEYEGISDSVTAGVRLGKDDALKAGEELAQSTAAGTRVGGRRVTTNPDVINAYKAGQSMETQTIKKGARRASRPAGAPGEKVSQAMQQDTNALDAHAEATNKSTSRLESLNSWVMNSTFALTSLAGVGILAGGAIGQISQKIFEFSGLLFALMQVTQLLTQAKFTELIASRLATAKQAMAFATYGTGIAATNGFIGSLSRAGIAVSAFLGPIGLVALGLAGLAGVIGLIVSAQEDQKKKIEGMGDAALIAGDKLKKLGDLYGFTPDEGTIGTAFIGAGTTSMAAEKKASELSVSDQFEADYAGEIAGVQAATENQATAILQSLAERLYTSGASQAVVEAIIKTIADKSGKQSLDLSFASINVQQNPAQLGAGLTKSVDGFISALKARAKEKDVELDFNSTTLKDLEFAAGTSFTNTLKEDAAIAAASLAGSFINVNTQLVNGTISAAQFATKVAEIESKWNALGIAGQSIVLPDLAKELNAEKTLEGITNTTDAFMLLKAAAAGLPAEEIAKYAAILKEAQVDNVTGKLTEDPKKLKAADTARKKLNTQIQKTADGLRNVVTQGEREAFINEKIGSATALLNDRVVALQDQSAAYQFLIDQGYKAEFAFELAGDAGLAAGIKAAAGAGVASKEWKDMEALINQIFNLEKNAPKAPTSASAKELTPYEEAIEQLEDQRKEIINTNGAYKKLINSGFALAEAMELAEDPILAAALATTEVGTKAWEQLVRKIKEVNNLLTKKELRDLLKTGKIEISDMKNQVNVSRALTSLGWSFEQIQDVLSDQEFTNTLAKDLADGSIDSKNLLNRLSQIKQLENLEVELNFTTKEGAAEEFQKLYDKVVGYLEAKKQVIEVDLQVKTASDEILARKAEEQIAAIQYVMDDYEVELQGIEEQEQKINEAYDSREKALEKALKANEAIAKQQKSQLTLADALAQGDIAAAARAAQEMRDQFSQEASAKQGDLLKLSREKALASLTSKSGKTRLQIEEQIKKLKDQILVIEEDILEPARERIRLATAEKDAQLDVINAQILRWEALSAKVNEAKLKLTPEEMAAMEYQAGLIADLLENWDKIDHKTAILTIIKKTLEEGDGDTGGFEEKVVKKDTTKGKTTTKATTKATTPGITVAKAADILNKNLAVKNAAKGADSAKASAALAKAAGVDIKRTTADTAERKITNAVSTALKTVAGKTADSIEKAIKAAKPATPPKGVSIRAMMKASGGMIPKRFAMGGKVGYYPMGGLIPYKSEVGSIFKPLGSDTVPAMLTPGEFVVRRHAVNSFGVDKLKAINSGTSVGDSVYNYNLSVNVKSDANPDDIARTVLASIKRVESQRIKGNRF